MKRQRILTSIPAKAGTHLSASRATEEWAPACAGVEWKNARAGARTKIA
jgi:hypothetical protein